ncbi:hypothetical protein CcaverHIS002_0600490 [Cutaneotrichosporon cavernicola]|nr:hypothetical protein CcaverHIS002_0600490 [Cutaneotrichosporon cavernicola]BEJ00203.1 hypothetical protein CcaverHIS631_0500600 [Cutaneotrichosporon cavernicola]BEJ07974.1 hypothetical protein CcaverHIS641_0500590 [Cutaneotrichosporon cavernicola]
MVALTISLPPVHLEQMHALEPPSPNHLTPASIDEPFHLYLAPSGDSATTLVGPLKIIKIIDCNPLEKVPSKVPSLDTSTSGSVTLDGDAPTKVAKADKASAKAAKRQARRDLNRAKRKAEAAAVERKQQPWEVTLGDIGTSAQGPSQSATTQIDSSRFTVPSECRYGRTLPIFTYDLSHAPAVAVVETLVADYGAWSITLTDPSYRIFLSPALDVAISFKVVRSLRVAVAFGDPVCHPARLPSAVADFHAFCRARGWGVAFVAARSATAKVAQVTGWATVQFAVEQIVEPASNPVLDGTRGRRQALVVKKLAREAPVQIYRPVEGRNAELESQLQEAYETVYAVKEERDGAPYSTKLRLFALPNLSTVLYTTDSTGLPNGIVGLLRVGEGRYLLDPLVATPSAPTGTTDYLTVLAMGYARRLGASLSFGTEPTPNVGEVYGMRRFMEAETRLVHAATYTAFGMDGKKTLHDKFHPSRSEALHLVLGSSGVLGQSAAAAAIWKATHLHYRPVIAPLVGLVEQRQAGETLEAMLSRLVERGQLRPYLEQCISSGSDTACEGPAED